MKLISSFSGTIKFVGVSVFFALNLPAFAESSGTEEQLNFRVSGIMNFGNDDFRGLIEAPDKSKRTLRVGDKIEDWSVARISGDCIHLQRNGQARRQCLTGTGETVEERQIAMPPAQQNAANQQAATTDTDEADENGTPSHFKKVDRTDFLQTLDRQANSDRLTLERLSESILPLAGLPADSVILEIDAAPLRSTQAAIEKMRQAVEQNRPIRLTLEAGEGAESIVYLNTE